MPEQPTFEEALSQIEKIVVGLERGEIELAQALTQYRQGLTLLAHCRRLIDQADQAVKLLTNVDPDGNPVTALFDHQATFTPPATTTPPPQARTPAGPSKATSPGRKVAPEPRDPLEDDYNPPF